MRQSEFKLYNVSESKDQCKRLMELSTVWGRLDHNTLKHVLSFLSVPELCRYSIVCKRWNEVIRMRKFALYCAENARKRDQSILLLRFYQMIPIGDPSSKPHGGWGILDFTTHRWYRVEDDPTMFMLPRSLAMDGGLICQFNLGADWSKTELEVFVYNPIAKTEKLRLPMAPTHGDSRYPPILQLVVDGTLSFKVFLVNHSFDKSEVFTDPQYREEDRLKVLNDPLVRLYDSTTNDWKSLTNPSCIQRAITHEICTVFFQGFLYVFVGSRTDEERRPLWRYKLDEDTWENVAVEILGNTDSPQLIVCANRLFFASWSKQERIVLTLSEPFQGDEFHRFCNFQVSEITITDEMTSLFKMPYRDVKKLFDIATDADETYKLLAFSLGNSLLFASADSQKFMAFDLRKKEWVPGPQVSSHHISESEIIWYDKPIACEMVSGGKLMNLILPNATPW